MKQKDIPFKERKRHYDYQFSLPDKQEELLLKKEEKRLRKLKEQALNNIQNGNSCEGGAE